MGRRNRRAADQSWGEATGDPTLAPRSSPQIPQPAVPKPAEGFTPFDPFPAATEMFGADRLARIAWAFVGLGIVIRTIRFLLNFPLWPDEAYLAHNYLDRGYLDLLRPLDYGQVAPLLYLWVQKTVVADLRFFRIFAAAVRLRRLDRQPAAVSSSGRPTAARHRAADGDRHLRRRLSAHPLFGRGQALRFRHAGDPAAAGVAGRVATGTCKRLAGSGPWPWRCRWPCCFPIRRCSSCRPSAWPC